MYEHRRSPLLPVRLYYIRLARHAAPPSGSAFVADTSTALLRTIAEIANGNLHRLRIGGGQVHMVMQVEPVDIPGIPVVGVIRVQLQQVAVRPRCEHLPLGGQVAHRGDQPVVVEAHLQ